MIYVQQLLTEFISTNATNPTAEWAIGTTYATADYARVDNTKYKSTIDGNLGNDPASTLGIYWIDWGASNDYAMLDLLSETKTEFTANGIVKFARGSNDTIGIGNFTASQITIEYLDAVDTVLDTDTYTFSNNGNVYDVWTYGYGGFTDSFDAVIYEPIKRLGENIRVTFSNSGSATDCGYMVVGIAEDMGTTLDNVNFPDKRIGSRTVSVANFKTVVEKYALSRKLASAKRLIDETMLFVIDPSDDSQHNNMVILGKITKVDGVGSYASVNNLSWQIEQTILE